MVEYNDRWFSTLTDPNSVYKGTSSLHLVNDVRRGIRRTLRRKSNGICGYQHFPYRYKIVYKIQCLILGRQTFILTFKLYLYRIPYVK